MQRSFAKQLSDFEISKKTTEHMLINISQQVLDVEKKQEQTYQRYNDIK